MVVLRSKNGGGSSPLLLLVLVLSILLIAAPNFVQGQEQEQDDKDQDEDIKTTPPSIMPLGPATPSTTHSLIPNASQVFVHATSSTTATNSTSTSPILPNPIFSTSDACVACQRQYFAIQNCSSHLPPAGVNLTMIVQLLPFYGCFCLDGHALIDASQLCSTCFRSTGQTAYLNPQFFNVTNQQVKAFKKVCTETLNGTRVPSSGTAGRLLVLFTWSGSWIVASSLLVIILPLMGGL